MAQPASAIDAATRDVDVDALVRDAQNGSEAAFNRLVAVFNGLVYNLAYRMAGNANDAEELTQAAFVRLFRALKQYRWRSKFSTWLYALAVNSHRSGLRRIRRIASREVLRFDRRDEADTPCREAVDPRQGPDGSVMDSELLARIEAVIAGLKPAYSTVIALRDMQGLTYDEIAAAVGCSVGTVKSRLARARMQVRERLKREGIVP